MKPKSSRPIILALVTFLAQTPLTATTFYILTFWIQAPDSEFAAGFQSFQSFT